MPQSEAAFLNSRTESVIPRVNWGSLEPPNITNKMAATIRSSVVPMFCSMHYHLAFYVQYGRFINMLSTSTFNLIVILSFAS